MSRIVRMVRQDPSVPWGFRLQGGREYNSALTIQKVSPGGMAQRHGVCAGDSVVSIGGDSVGGWSHHQAQQAIIRCGNELELGLLHGGGQAPYQPMPQQPAAYQPTTQYQPLRVSGGGGHSVASWQPRQQQQQQQQQQQRFENQFSSPYSPAANQSSPGYGGYSPAANQSSPGYGGYPAAANQSAAAPARAAAGGGVSGRSRRGDALRRMPNPQQQVPICSTCGSVIRGPFLVAVDNCYCPDHFYCSVCNRNLESCGFVEDAGSLYCEDDYVRLLAPKCGGCQATIVADSVHAMDQYFHRQCFVCAHCRQSIAGKQFRVEDNRPYCEKDWGELFFTKCGKCQESISPLDRFIEALGCTFHADCFCCAVCGTRLEGKPFAPKDGKAYCKAHARRF